MPSATVTSKGQLVIPIELRHQYFIKPGTRVHLKAVESGILLKPFTKESIRRLRGCLAGLGISGDLEREADREIE